MEIGLLDFGLSENSLQPIKALEQTISRAKRADHLGYCRYWLGEHYDRKCAWAYAPPLAVALLAETENISIGTGGLLLSLHDPFRVACDASLISALYPGRFELGLGRGSPEPPWDQVISANASDYALKLELLISHLENKHAAQGLIGTSAIPIATGAEAIWVLGSGSSSAPLAVHHNLPFCLSLFHGEALPPAPDIAGHFMIAVAGSCAPTLVEATHRLKGENFNFHPRVVGNGNQCYEGLMLLKKHYKADSVMFLELVRDQNYRLQGMALLAQAAAGKK